mgnify:FL=1
MKTFFREHLSETTDSLMNRAGYERHCVEAGKDCFHRRLNEHPFPRFHAYVSMRSNGMEIDLHFDQYDMHRRGNHDQAWAYKGGRVDGELQRIIETLKGLRSKARINQPGGTKPSSRSNGPNENRSLFDILFR